MNDGTGVILFLIFILIAGVLGSVTGSTMTSVEGYKVRQAQQVCEERGGVYEIYGYQFVCNDGSVQEYQR